MFVSVVGLFALFLSLPLAEATAHASARLDGGGSSFLEGTVYQYEYESSAELHENLQVSLRAKLSLRVAGERGKLGKEGDGGVSHDSGIRSGTAAGGGEEIRVSFGEAVLTFSNRSSKDAPYQHQDTDFLAGELEKWFSFVRGKDGVVSSVLHTDKESPTSLAFKKSIAALFSVVEEGSEYQMLNSQLVVSSTQTFPLQDGREKLVEKEMVYESTGLLYSVNLKETVEESSNEGQKALLGQTLLSTSHLLLTEQLPASSHPSTPTLTPSLPPDHLVSDSLEITMWQPITPLSHIEAEISRQISCASQSVKCKSALVSLLRQLSFEDLQELAVQYLDFEDTTLIDALSQLRSPEVSTLLSTHVLEEAHRFSSDQPALTTLLHLATVLPPTEDVMTTVHGLAFGSVTGSTSSHGNQETNSQRSVSKRVRHRAVLALGAMAGRHLYSQAPGGHGLSDKASQLIGHLKKLLKASLSHTGSVDGVAATSSAHRHNDDIAPQVLLHSLGNTRSPDALRVLEEHVMMTSVADGEEREEGGRGGGRRRRDMVGLGLTAIRAMKQFTCTESAATLERLAVLGHLPDAITTAAARLYQSHPRRSRDLSHLLDSSSEEESSNSRSGVHLIKRSTSDSGSSLECNVSMPAVRWGRHIGDSNVSVDLERTVANDFQLSTAPFYTKYKLSLRDKAAFRSSFLLSTGEKHNEMLRTEFCLDAEISYNANLLTDFVYDLKETQFARHTAIADQLADGFQLAEKMLRDSESGYHVQGSSPGGLTARFQEAIDDVLTRHESAGQLFDAFMQNLNEIPVEFDLKSRGLELFDAANFLLDETNQLFLASVDNISSAVSLVDPVPASSALMVDGQSFIDSTLYVPYLPFAPQRALANIFNIYVSVEKEVTTLQSSVDTVLHLTDPYGINWKWVSPSVRTGELRSRVSTLLLDVERAVGLDQSFAGVGLSDLLVLQDAIKSLLQEGLSIMEEAASLMLEERKALTDALLVTRESFRTFAQAYEGARSQVDSIFGQKFHPDFPRHVMSCDPELGGTCGAYPSTSGGLYRDGIDLEVESATKIVAPLSSTVQLLDGSHPLGYSASQTVLITPRESSFQGYSFVITNFVPSDSISSEPAFVSSGNMIDHSNDFGSGTGPATFVHLEAYKELAGTRYAVNPTQFLQPVLDPTISTEILECNDVMTYVGGVAVDHALIVQEDPLKVYVGDPLVEGIPRHEFPRPFDRLVSAESESELASPQDEAVGFYQSSTFIMVGSIPVQFEFSASGRYSVGYSLEVGLLSKRLSASVTPQLHAWASGTMKVGSTQYALVELSGTVVESSLPISLHQEFNSWPLQASSSMDLVLVPSTLELTATLVQLTGAGEFASEETLLFEVLWRYSIPPVDRNEFSYVGTLVDETAPVFETLSYDDTHSDQSGCFVRQLPGRPHALPAFELEFDLKEEQSRATVRFRVGTFYQGSDVIKDRMIEGSRIFLSDQLVPATQLHFTVLAENSNALLSSGTCWLERYDRSPPLARIVPIKDVSSHPSMIQALVVLFDEFGLENSELEISVGSVPGGSGNDIMDWRPFNTSEIYTPPDDMGNSLDLFSFPRDGRLFGGVLSTFLDVSSAQLCATRCSQDPRCLSFDHSARDAKCVLHDVIEGPDDLYDSYGVQYENVFAGPLLVHAESYRHFERLGVGNSTLVLFDFAGSPLEQNRVYHVNMRLRNRLGYASVATSRGFLTDRTPPHPGLILDPISDSLAVIGCDELVSFGLAGCSEESGMENFRMIVDGSGTTSVYNGPVPFLDALYTSANNYIAASWDGFVDLESGIFKFTWCVGTALGSCDLLGPIDPHYHLASRQHWTNTGLAGSHDLPNGSVADGFYYSTVRAISDVAYGGPLVTSVAHSTPYLVDTQPPTISGVSVDGYDSSDNILSLNFLTSDGGAGSGVDGVSFALGRTPRDTALVGWTPLGTTAGPIDVSVLIPDGVSAWVKLRATDRVGLSAIEVADTVVMVDRTAPIAGQVRDGEGEIGDSDYQSSYDTICINWDGFRDPDTGISSYTWSVEEGTTPGGDLVFSEQLSVMQVLEGKACKEGLTLPQDTIYFSTIEVANGATTDQKTASSTSDGVRVDFSPLTSGTVQDGSDPGVDQSYSSSLTSVSAQWSGFSDPESGIDRYVLEVYRKPSLSAEPATIIHTDEVGGAESSVTWNHFSLGHGDKVYVSVTAVNGAGMSAVSSSDGYTVDVTPPELDGLIDGIGGPADDLDYQTSLTSLSFSWVARDPESDISLIEVSVYEAYHGQRRLFHPNASNDENTTSVDPSLTSESIDGLNLTPGARYTVSLVITNGAGKQVSYETDGVTVDPIAPVVDSVTVVSDTCILEEADDGGSDDENSLSAVVIVANLNQVQLRWSGSDAIGKIAEYSAGIVQNGTAMFVKDYVGFGAALSGVIDALLLEDGETYQAVVVAKDTAGSDSVPTYSEPFRVAVGDRAGVVMDGDNPEFGDIDYTNEVTSISAHFEGFVGLTCGGISRYEWAVGRGDGNGNGNRDDMESVLPFTDSGLVVFGNGSGYAQVPLPDLDAYEGQPLFVTVRGISGCDKVLESTSDGFVIDTTPPDLKVGIDNAISGSSQDNLQPVYQASPSLSATLELVDTESSITGDSVAVKIGTFPGGSNIKSEELVVNSESYIFREVIQDDVDYGLPIYVTLLAQNGAGGESVAVSNPLVVDTSPPVMGEITCSTLNTEHDYSSAVLSCQWTGVYDPESTVATFSIAVGTAPADQSVMSKTTLAERLLYYQTPPLELLPQQPYYVTLFALNGAGLENLIASEPVFVDSTAPINEGPLFVVPNYVSAEFDASGISTVGVTGGYLAGESARCLLETDVVTILFEAFKDSESEIERYMVAAGSFPNSGDILPYIAFVPETTETGLLSHTLSSLPLDVTLQNAIFVSVLAYTSSLYAFLTSEPLFVKSSDTNSAWSSSWIRDGPLETEDIDYQSSTNEISGSFQFGVNCPITEVKWAVESVDGLLAQAFTPLSLTSVGYKLESRGTYAVDNEFQVSSDQMAFLDMETYRLLVQAVDATGERFLLKSDGLTIITRGLVPGLVQDGPIPDLDLNYQESTTSLHAHWSGFGDGTPEQEIWYYQVAVGSNSEYPSTRTDVVPFTDVGTSTSHVLTGLSLVPETVQYFVTVRAHSVSGVYVDSTSNGISVGFEHAVQPGRVLVPSFQHNTTTLQAYWDGFESTFPIRSYEWALTGEQMSAQGLKDLCLNISSDYASLLDVRSFTDVGLETSFSVHGLSLQHNSSYFVIVRAVDEGDRCVAVSSEPLLVDTSAPLSQGIAVGTPETISSLDAPTEEVVFIQPGADVLVEWESFVDGESGIETYTISLMQLENCQDPYNGTVVIAGYKDAGGTNEEHEQFLFEGVQLSVGVSYGVVVEGANRAGLTTRGTSQPIVVDAGTIVMGTVKDGDEWESDLVFQSDLSSLTAVFVHLMLQPEVPGGGAEPNDPCPNARFHSLSSVNDEPAWSSTEPTLVGVANPTSIVYQEAQVNTSAAGEVSGVEIAAVRLDTDVVEQVISGAYETEVDLSGDEALVALDVRAAIGSSQVLQREAVTSVVLVDGLSEGFVPEFEPDGPAIDFSDIQYFKAVGLQVHHSTTLNPQRVILWAYTGDPLSSPSFVSQEFYTDLSRPHRYHLQFRSEQQDTQKERWLELAIDGEPAASLFGTPSFSSSVRLVCHVFTYLGFVPSTEMSHEVSAVFANVSLPLMSEGQPSVRLCDYGTPFFSRGSPIFRFRAGIGTGPGGSTDLQDWETVSLPCHPCLPGPCSSYGCQVNCSAIDPYVLRVSFTNLSLSSGTFVNQSELSADSTTTTDPAKGLTDHFQPAVYYVAVEAVTSSGQRAVGVSSGVTIDVTPPLPTSPVLHYDASSPPVSSEEPVSFQGSNSSIVASWQFHDTESGIVEYRWAIGTAPNITDIQGFYSVGSQTQARNDSLLGLIEHNVTYYVTVEAVNGAGLSTVAVSDGVTYVATELNRTGIEPFVVVEYSVGDGDAALEDGVFVDSDGVVLVVVAEGDRAGVRWEGVEEEVEEIYWSIGSAPGLDDILPRTDVSFNMSQSAFVADGILYLNSTAFANLSEIIALAEGKGVDPADNVFNVEPGRIVYHTLEFCNLVHRCVVVETNGSVVIPTQDEVASGQGNVTIELTQGSLLASSILNKKYTLSVSTTGGLQPQTKLVVGFLSESDVRKRYRVSLPYISNPYETMDQTSREIARRFTELGGPSFYISFLGQSSLQGPLLINVTFDSSLDWSEADPSLVYWDVAEEVWREVDATCETISTIDWSTFTIATEVCSTASLSTSSSSSNGVTKRQSPDESNSTAASNGSTAEQEFLHRPTHFAVVQIGNFSLNSAPQLVIPAEPVPIPEDTVPAFQIQLDFADPEGDTVQFHLSSPPALGNASITTDGLVSYTPCANCIGADSISIYILEDPFGINTRLSSTGLLHLSILNSNDQPRLFLYASPAQQERGVADSIYSISVVVESNRTEPVVIARVGSYDYDGYHDDLEVQLEQPTTASGTASFRNWLDMVNTPESAPVDWPQDWEVALFNGFVVFNGFDVTYLPRSDVSTAMDQVTVRVRDTTGVASQPVTVSVEVVESWCLNGGVCDDDGGLADPSCSNVTARRTGFEGYNCSCPDGFEGPYCEIALTSPTVIARDCPPGVPMVTCDGDPCEGAVCPSHALAECRPDYCGKCVANWFTDDEQVACSVDTQTDCSKPASEFADCSDVTCDCQELPFPCPEDSILIEIRVSLCCVRYECSCPNVTCPLAMGCGQGVQPHPRERGVGFPGNCCPSYEFNDINECLEDSENLCTTPNSCVNQDFSYSCQCQSGTLSNDGYSCGVCPYDNMEYLLGDRVMIGCNWCICEGDMLSAERWACTGDTCVTGCRYNGAVYPLGSQLQFGSNTCNCIATDTSAEWSCRFPQVEPQ